MKRIVANALILVVAGVGAYALIPKGEGAQTGDTRLAQGAALYAENCAACHGANLEGQADWRTRNDDGTLRAPPHDRTGHTWHHSDAQLFTYTKLGGQEAMADMTNFVSGMPGFGDILTDDEIRSILDYIKSSWPEDIRAAQSQMSQ